MKLVFMGNPDFAIPSLERLINSTHDLRAVVTNPPKRMGRGKRPQLTPVGKWARDHDLPLLQPKSLLDSAFHEQLRALESDIFVVVAYRILPKMVLSIPSIGAVNLHASILPAYRGAAPIQWALLNGDSQTGVTTFLIQPKVDTGDILMRETVDILPEDNFGSLSDRLSRVGADCLHKTLDGLTNNTIKPKPQDESQVSRAPKITPDMRWIDWENSAIKIHNQVRALTPKPGSLTIGDSKRIKNSENNTDTGFQYGHNSGNHCPSS